MSGQQDARVIARLFAVQALYQMELAKTPLETVIREFRAYRLEEGLDGISTDEPDEAHFDTVLRGVVEHQTVIDRRIDGHLSQGWKLSRIDSTLRAILRCGAFELLFLTDIPRKAITSCYTDVAHGFFDGPEGGMTNALLDNMARGLEDERI
jgi:N utilization substance protein B